MTRMQQDFFCRSGVQRSTERSSRMTEGAKVAQPRVWHERDPLKPDSAIYVGRPSRWGNPYRIGRDGTREEVIALYEEYARDRLRVEPDWLESLRGRDLVCWCAPQACHGDVLLRLLSKHEDQEEEEVPGHDDEYGRAHDTAQMWDRGYR